MPENILRIENTRAEHGHRMIAGAVALLTLALVVWIWRTDSRGWLKKVALASIIAVVTQALLGGMTVIFLLPPQISVSHALLGQTFFCLNVSLALMTSPRWKATPEKIDNPGGIHFSKLCYILVATIFLQLFVGAVMRHTRSGLAVPDFPLAYGTVIPPTDEVAMHNLNIDRDVVGLEKIAPWQIWLHLTHRAWAFAVLTMACWVGIRAFRQFARRAELLFPAALIWILVVMQIMLGALTIWSGKHPYITTLHVATGAAILGMSVILSLESTRSVRASALAAGDAPGSPSLERGEVTT